MSESLQDFKRYIGQKTAPVHDVITASAMEKIAATLGLEGAPWARGDTIPAGWHIASFPPVHRPSNMRSDGLPVSGGNAVPVPLPRRRLGGVRTSFHEPLRIGDEISVVSEIADIRVDQDANGPMLLLVDRSSISCARGLAVVEETDRIWMSEGRAAVKSAAAPAIPERASWTRVIEADPVLLFRASAAKFNSHRIHYDRDYATKVEGLPGLAVQVTLVALFLMEMCRQEMPGRTMTHFAHQRVRQFYDTGAFTIAGILAADGSQAACWVLAPEGDLAMTATARFAA